MTVEHDRHRRNIDVMKRKILLALKSAGPDGMHVDDLERECCKDDRTPEEKLKEN